LVKLYVLHQWLLLQEGISLSTTLLLLCIKYVSSYVYECVICAICQCLYKFCFTFYLVYMMIFSQMWSLCIFLMFNPCVFRVHSFSLTVYAVLMFLYLGFMHCVSLSIQYICFNIHKHGLYASS
jgi:hypothetical protein